MREVYGGELKNGFFYSVETRKNIAYAIDMFATNS